MPTAGSAFAASAMSPEGSSCEPRPPDLIVSDIMMPEMDGYEMLATLRKGSSADLPVIAVTAQAMVGDREKCLAAGADDYVTKPFELQELEARALALTRRKDKIIEDRIQFGEYTLEVGKKIVKIGENPVELTTKEYGIIEYLGRNQ